MIHSAQRSASRKVSGGAASRRVDSQSSKRVINPLATSFSNPWRTRVRDLSRGTGNRPDPGPGAERFVNHGNRVFRDPGFRRRTEVPGKPARSGFLMGKHLDAGQALADFIQKPGGRAARVGELPITGRGDLFEGGQEFLAIPAVDFRGAADEDHPSGAVPGTGRSHPVERAAGEGDVFRPATGGEVVIRDDAEIKQALRQAGAHEHDAAGVVFPRQTHQRDMGGMAGTDDQIRFRQHGAGLDRGADAGQRAAFSGEGNPMYRARDTPRNGIGQSERLIFVTRLAIADHP